MLLRTIAGLSLLLAAVLFVPVLVDYVQTGLVERFPTLIVCGFMVLAAIQSFFSGMILSQLAAKERREFESRLIQTEDTYKRCKDGK